MDREPTELEITIAAPFRHMRKTQLKRMEFLFYYTQDKKWLSSEQVRKLLPLAESCGILSRDETSGEYTLNEELSDIKIITGFRPTDAVFDVEVPESADPVTSLLSDVAKATGKDEQSLAREIEAIKKHFDGLIYTEAAVVVLARKYGVATAKYQPELLKMIEK